MNLESAIDSLYHAFGDVPAPKVISACPCCIGEKEIENLLSTPVRELSAEDLSSYGSSALLTVGETSDYLYFLPRIIELSTHDEFIWPSIEVTARAIDSSGLSTWPQTKRNALVSVLTAFIDEIISAGRHNLIDEWMCAVGRMDLDVQPFLEIIESNPQAVLEYWEDNADKLNENCLGNAFWELPNEQHDEIVRWFKTPRIELIYAEAYGYRST